MNKKLLLTLTERQNEMAEAIKSYAGYNNATEVLRRGLEELYFKYFPAYRPLPKDAKNLSKEDSKSRAEAKLKLKEIEKKAEHEMKIKNKIDMAENLLGGEVIEDEEGYKYCVFTTYTLNGDTVNKIPIEQVDPLIARTSLFMPSKEIVFAKRGDVRIKFRNLSYYKDDPALATLLKDKKNKNDKVV